MSFTDFRLTSMTRSTGRAWHAEELRRKSFDDLHTLWYKLIVERNALYTQREEMKRNSVDGAAYSYIPEYLHRVSLAFSTNVGVV